jgi:polar amino acid transport system substrate-binding protein
MTPEEALEGVFTEGTVTPTHQKDILSYMHILFLRDAPTFYHSVRVGLLSANIADVAGSHPPGKMLLWAGLLHDIGKILIPPHILSKTKEFSDEDYEAMEAHPKLGWDMLHGIHDYTAAIVVRHHRFGPKPYPSVLPPLPAHLISREDIVDRAARLLALADYYDAMMNRKNDKFGGAPQNSQEKREKYIHDNADQAVLVEKLIDLGVLTF